MRNAGRKCMILGGMLLIAAAFCVAGYNFLEAQKAAESAKNALEDIENMEMNIRQPKTEEKTKEKEEPVPGYVLDPEMEMPVAEVDGTEFVGILEIPALELSLPVINEWSYEKLEVAPCRYMGSAYKDDLIIAAHNYEGHFGDLSGLAEGDEILFWDMEGNLFTYSVSGPEELPGTAIEEMEAGEWDLTLFTCTLSGQNRVTVRCDRLNDDQTSAELTS